MKLDQIAFGLFRRAYHAVLASPGDVMAHKRFDKWAKLVGRIVGLPITGCHETHGPVRDRWVHVTAAALVAVMTAHYAAGVWRDPSKPQNPAPPRSAITPLVVASASTGTGASFYVAEMITGKEFRVLMPLPRKPTSEST